MKIYSYVLKTASGDLYHKILVDKDYPDAIEFMKAEVPEEYEAWEEEWDIEAWGPWDDSTIDYEDFDKEVLEIP